MSIYHIHHIIPRHMGGTDDPSNLVKLTIEEHAEAHKKLWEDHGSEYDRIAWLGLSGLIDGEQARIEAVKVAIRGIPKSEEHRKKISEARKKDWETNDALREKISKLSKGNNYGRLKAGWDPSEETRKRMSESAKKRTKSYIVCDLCGKKVTTNNIRSHKKFSHNIT